LVAISNDQYISLFLISHEVHGAEKPARIEVLRFIDQ
jgi:hypothetical protein